MNQQEVALIYDYLHGHYEYNDGELICKENIKHSKRKGDKMGVFKVHPEGYGYYTASFSIEKKVYYKRVSHLVWLYFHKALPLFIWYNDENPLNTHIENLVSSRVRQPNSKNYIQRASGSFNASIVIDGERIALGAYRDECVTQQVVKKAKYLAATTKVTSLQIKECINDEFGAASVNQLQEKERELPVGVRYSGYKFRAVIKTNGEKITLGVFDTAKEASKAYQKAKKAKTDVLKTKAEDYSATKAGELRKAIKDKDYSFGSLRYSLGAEVFYRKDYCEEYCLSKGILIGYVIDTAYKNADEAICYKIKDSFTDQISILLFHKVWVDKDSFESELMEDLCSGEDIFEMEAIEDNFFD